MYLTLASCSKSGNDLVKEKTIQNNSDKNKITLTQGINAVDNNSGEPTNPVAIIPWIIGAVVIIIVLASGKKHTIETTDMYGAKVLKTDCIGIGTCASAIEVPSTNNSNGEYDLTGNFAVTNSGHIALIVNPAENGSEFNTFFYGDKISYLNPGETLTISNPQILNSLNRTAPINIHGGEFDVYTTNNGSKYIIVE